MDPINASDGNAIPSDYLTTGIMRQPFEIRCNFFDLVRYSGQYLIDRAYSQVLAQRETARINARADAVDFRPVPGSPTPIMRLPREIRDLIYDKLLRYDEQNDRNHSIALMVWHGPQKASGSAKPIGARALPVTNRAVHAVHFVQVGFDIRRNITSFPAKDTLPVNASRMLLYRAFEDSWPVRAIAKDKVPFEPIFATLAICQNLTELMCTIKHCTVSAAAHQEVVKVIEALPKLRRYMVNTGGMKSWGKRSGDGMSWESPMAEKSAHTGVESYGAGFGGEWREFVANMSPDMDRRIF